jgi:hypothetical protein
MKMLWGRLTPKQWMVVNSAIGLFVTVMMLTWAMLYLYNLPPANRSITGVPVTAVFVDVDKDGTQDLLVYGEVIYNPTPLAVTQ